MEESKILLKPINKLIGHSFFIPDYQRGYRWDKRQVEDLLNDIEEFKESLAGDDNTERIYCLQPLVVKEIDEPDKYSVIDGQQRLTTIKILLSCLGEIDNYYIEYQTREKSKSFLEDICNKDCKDEWTKNADFFHMYHAKDTIEKWFDGKDDDYKQDFLKIVKERVNFVWYESDDPDPIKVFTRLNIGKIGLTESELIKALFLSSNNFNTNETTENKYLTLVEIANEWDKIEYRLQDDRFWLFFHGTDYNKPTRIDYILDIVRKRDKDSKNIDGEMYPTFRYFYEGFKKADKKQEYLTDRWKEISQIYQILEEWYNDEELYHYIGFLCTVKPNAVFYIEEYLRKESKNEIKTKNGFIQYLKGEIKKGCGDALDFDREYEGDNALLSA